MAAVVILCVVLSAFSCAEKILNNEIFPWIGILKVEFDKEIQTIKKSECLQNIYTSLYNIEAVTGIILIAEAIAVGNAQEVSKVDKNTLRKSSKAIFFEGKISWGCHIKDYVIHPEFRDTVNTVALVYLDCIRQIWTPIKWPKGIILNNVAYFIGLSDRRGELNKIMYKMSLVNNKKCRVFYKNEKIGHEHLWPSNCLCYKAANIKKSCNFDSGMALGILYKGNWTLLGISILGPGCNLPSRYINFQKYIPWIDNLIQKTDFRRSGENVKNETKVEIKVINPTDDVVSDSYDIADDFYVSKLDDSTMVLRPGKANVREAVYGDCLNNEGVMMYREAGLVRAPGYTAIGIYALSLYDLFYNKITCVMVSVRCKQRTISKFWYEKGFNKDDFSDLIKVVPFPRPVPPKVLFITDSYQNYDNMSVANLLFKFEFQNEASVNIDFYGSLSDGTTTTITSTSSTISWKRRGINLIACWREKIIKNQSPTVNAIRRCDQLCSYS